ncbi:MAG: WbqC family protein [Bacteroidaceae bacterium]|nr:WbqC family protein [Bacteroidaceae bacterium]
MVNGQCLLSSCYLPPVEWFTKLCRYERVWVEQYDNYQKQTYRNRCVIDSPNGPLALTLPVEKVPDGKNQMKDVRISDHNHWRSIHWHALSSSYLSSPFFEYYQDDFRPFYEQKWTFLMDFNEALVAKCCELIDLQPDIHRTPEYIADSQCSMTDFRSSIHPKQSCEEDTEFVSVPYYQVFLHKHGFLPNLSIVDLIFNMGSESLIVLMNSFS